MEEFLELLLLEEKLRQIKHASVIIEGKEVPVKKLTDMQLADTIRNLEMRLSDENIISENLGARDEF